MDPSRLRPGKRQEMQLGEAYPKVWVKSEVNCYGRNSAVVSG